MAQVMADGVAMVVGHVEGRLVITAVVLEKRPVGHVVQEYGVCRSWVYKLLPRCRTEGDEAAFEPRSRAPYTSPAATPPSTVDLVLGLRKQLSEAGQDAGADTIGWHLAHHHRVTVPRATIHRVLHRAGAVVPDPAISHAGTSSPSIMISRQPG